MPQPPNATLQWQAQQQQQQQQQSPQMMLPDHTMSAYACPPSLQRGQTDSGGDHAIQPHICDCCQVFSLQLCMDAVSPTTLHRFCQSPLETAATAQVQKPQARRAAPTMMLQ
jgi:hypothetical protein